MKDILLNMDRNSPNYGDISFNNCDISFTDSVVQSITVRLRWFLGEWKYVNTFGVPYYEEFFVKNPSLELLRGRLITVVSSVSEVEEVKSMDLSMDNKKRRLSVNFVVKVNGNYEIGNTEISFEI